MRGQSLEEFLKTRNTQVLYPVAGSSAPTGAPGEAPADAAR
jgi:hypothetical protein